MKFPSKTLYFKRIIPLLLILLFAQFVFSQNKFYESGTISNSFHFGDRKIIDLAGEWDLYSGDNKQNIRIPSAFDGESKITLQNKFFVDEKDLGVKSFQIFSYGINHRAEFYLNEVFIGKHDGGYLPFSILIKDNLLQAGENNYLKIIVDNRLDAYQSLPLHQQIGGWKNYGGIIRDIFIGTTARVFIEDVKISTQNISNTNSTILITSKIFGQELSEDYPSIQILAEVTDINSGSIVSKYNSQSFIPKSNRDIENQFPMTIANSQLWSVESPNRYLIKVKIQNSEKEIIDEVNYKFGIRKVEIVKDKFIINGQNIFVNGISWIEGNQKQRASMSYSEMEKDVAVIKSTGANAIRFAFHPPHPFMLELCDKYGLLAFVDVPIFEMPLKQIKSEFYKNLTENYLSEALNLSHSHPSFVAISVGDRLQSDEEASKNFVNKLVNLVRNQSDLATYYTTSSNDSLLQNIKSDFIFINPPTKNIDEMNLSLDEFKSNLKNRPLIIGKYGKETEPKNRNGFSNPNSYESQAKYFIQRYATIGKKKFTGGFVWAFSDYEEDKPSLTALGENYFLRSYGIVEFNRQKRPAFETIQSLYLKEKITPFEVGTYSISTPLAYIITGLLTLIFFAWYYNTNRRFRDNMVRSLLRPFNFYSDVRDQKSLPFSQTIIVAIIISVTIGIIISTALFRLRTSLTLDYLLSYFFPSDEIKIFLITIVKYPSQSVAYISFIVMAMLFINSIVIQIIAFLSRVKIYFFHAYSMIVWSAIPIILFIPIGMILYRIIETEFYFYVIAILFLLVLIWIFFRTIHGVSVVYDIPYLQVSTLSLIAAIVLFLIIGIYFNEKYALNAYIDFFFTTIEPSL